MRADCKIQIGPWALLGILLGVGSGCFTSGYDGIPFESQNRPGGGDASTGVMRADGQVADARAAGDLGTGGSSCLTGCDAMITRSVDAGGGHSGPTDAGSQWVDSGAGQADAGPWPRDGGPVTASGLSRPVHRYTFEGTGTDAEDSEGEAQGLLKSGATLSGSGSVILEDSGGYVDLPNGILKDLDGVTLIMWFRWYGGECGQTLFDLGSSGEGEGAQGESPSSVSVTPYSCSLLSFGRFEARYRGEQVFGNEETLGTGGASADRNVVAMAAITVDSSASTMAVALYDSGSYYEQEDVALDLSELDDNNNWLGRSQVPGYPTLNAEILEFRVYDYAMTEAQLQLVRDTGSDEL